MGSQHNLKPTSLRNYRHAVEAFERCASTPFESVYLDSARVHEALNKLDELLDDSSWNKVLVLLKRYAKRIYRKMNQNMPDTTMYYTCPNNILGKEKWLKLVEVTLEDFEGSSCGTSNKSFG